MRHCQDRGGSAGMLKKLGEKTPARHRQVACEMSLHVLWVPLFFGGGKKTIKLQFDKFFSGNVVERDFFYREVCTTRTFSKLVKEDFFFQRL